MIAKSRIAAVLVALVYQSGCGLPVQDDAPFADQNFKSAIAAIELHRVRTGAYPDALADIRFLGDWDALWQHAVEYRRVEDGYALDVRGASAEALEIEYPSEFWDGLGLRQSNLKRDFTGVGSVPVAVRFERRLD